MRRKTETTRLRVVPEANDAKAPAVDPPSPALIRRLGQLLAEAVLRDLAQDPSGRLPFGAELRHNTDPP